MPSAAETRSPLVTFALFAYNQEQFIREAVGAALAQTYSPLQIILSDDRSSDRTFEIMQDMAIEYRGPHEILLNHNERNLGVGAHVNRLMDLAKGELIVAAAGDDVSVPGRAAILVEQWLANSKPSALCSGFVCVDESGAVKGDGKAWFSLAQFPQDASGLKSSLLLRFIKTHKPALIGCTEAWSRDVFENFGPLQEDVWLEDYAISLRAWFLKGIHFFPEQLVSYRQHTHNIWNRAWTVDRSVSGFRRLEEIAQERARRWVTVLIGYERDIDTALKNRMIDLPLANEMKRAVARQIEMNRMVGNWWSADVPKRVCWYLGCLLRQEHRELMVWGVARLVPYEVFLSVRSLLSRARGWSRELAKAIQS